jgi:hypothetical protein
MPKFVVCGSRVNGRQLAPRSRSDAERDPRHLGESAVSCVLLHLRHKGVKRADGGFKRASHTGHVSHRTVLINCADQRRPIRGHRRGQPKRRRIASGQRLTRTNSRSGRRDSNPRPSPWQSEENSTCSPPSALTWSPLRRFVRPARPVRPFRPFRIPVYRRTP